MGKEYLGKLSLKEYFLKTKFEAINNRFKPMIF